MLVGIRHTAILGLWYALITLMMACGDTQPLPENDASLEATRAKENLFIVHLDEWQTDCPPDECVDCGNWHRDISLSIYLTTAL